MSFTSIDLSNNLVGGETTSDTNPDVLKGRDLKVGIAGDVGSGQTDFFDWRVKDGGVFYFTTVLNTNTVTAGQGFSSSGTQVWSGQDAAGNAVIYSTQIFTVFDAANFSFSVDASAISGYNYWIDFSSDVVFI